MVKLFWTHQRYGCILGTLCALCKLTAFIVLYFAPSPPFRQRPYVGSFFQMKAFLRMCHKAMTTIFISAMAEDHGIALTNSKIVSQIKMTEKDNIPKADKFRYFTLLAVTALWGNVHGLPIDKSLGKKEQPTMFTNSIET